MDARVKAPNTSLYLIAIIFQSELNVKCITFLCINKFMSGKKVLNVILHIGSMNPIILGCQLNVSTLDWGGKKKKALNLGTPQVYLFVFYPTKVLVFETPEV